MAERKNVPIRADAIVPESAAYNKYYMRVSSRYGAAKWITLLLFTVYLLCMLAVGRSSITYENFMYLLRDFNLSSGVSGAYTSVTYEEQQNMSFAEYKNTLAVTGSAGVRLYDGAGNLIFRDSTAYKTPVLVTSERYMLLYDEGGRDFSVMTTLARVLSDTTDGEILCGAAADSGHFAIVSRTSEAHYSIDIYDASLKNIESVYRDSYITGAAFDETGETLAVLAVQAEDWSLSSTIQLLRVGSDTVVNVSLGAHLPLYCKNLNNGNWAVVCDDTVFLLTHDGNILKEIPLTSMTLSQFHISDRLLVLVCTENVLGNANKVLVINDTGEIIIENSCDRKLSGVYASSISDTVYLVYDNAVECIGATGNGTQPFTGSLMQICELSGNIVFCFPSGAYAAAFQ